MVNKKQNEPTLENLIELVEQVSHLIEDNNQNMKDCYRLLKQIKEQVCPKRQTLFTRILSKLINKK